MARLEPALYTVPEMSDLFSSSAATASDNYDASAIEVLEGLEPVRRRPGMYIGGTDARALHHLAAEVVDNCMDEAVAGFASRIEVTLEVGNRLTVADNGRGIPVDPHPKYRGKSALEVIMTTLHSGGKFEGKAYSTSGGLHGVGVSVVNALSTETVVEVARDKTLYRQTFSKGLATSKLQTVGAAPNRRGTTVIFTPDPEIFGADAKFELYNGSDVRKAVERKGGRSVLFPDMADRVSDALYSDRLSIAKAWRTMPIGNRAELRRWLEEVNKIFPGLVDA